MPAFDPLDILRSLEQRGVRGELVVDVASDIARAILSAQGVDPHLFAADDVSLITTTSLLVQVEWRHVPALRTGRVSFRFKGTTYVLPLSALLRGGHRRPNGTS